MWCDYLRMLKKNLGQDLRNPKNICPEDFMAAHDNATRKIEAIHEKEKEPQGNAVGRLKGVSVSNSDNSKERKMRKISSPTNPNSSAW